MDRRNRVSELGIKQHVVIHQIRHIVIWRSLILFLNILLMMDHNPPHTVHLSQGPDYRSHILNTQNGDRVQDSAYNLCSEYDRLVLRDGYRFFAVITEFLDISLLTTRSAPFWVDEVYNRPTP